MGKKVLIITYYWPPSGGSGVQRWVYFSRFFKDMGLEPIVLTVDGEQASYRYIDNSLEGMVSTVETHRTSTLEPLKLYSQIVGGDKRKNIPQGIPGDKKPGLLEKIFRFVRGNFFVPDARVGWNKYAIKQALELFKNNDINTIITTGPPHSTHLIGLYLKNKTGVNWIADFRDPWSEIYFNNLLYQTNYAKNKNESLEQKVLEKSDYVISVGPTLTKLLQVKLPVAEQGKFLTFHNGYDSDKMASLPQYKPGSKFIISHIGVLTDDRPVDTFIKALQQVIAEMPEMATNIEFHAVGDITENNRADLQQVFTGQMLKLHGYMAHSKALEQMCASDLLLNVLTVTAESKLVVSGKLMEYLASGRPMLCLGVTDGDAADLAKGYELAKVCEQHDINGMAELIKTVYQRWKNGANTSLARAGVEHYSRKAVSQRLAELIQNIR